MPIYEYKCEKCGKELEVLHKVSEPAPAECPSCHEAGSMARLVSRTSFQLKGGGWYSDLYSSKKSESATPAPATPAGATTTSTTPSAPAASPTAAPSTSSSGTSGGSNSGGSST